ncbi:hypothetical protein [Pelotalea chapellei]|uniref:Outer membrane scaffolding protein for murein synthesis (MipA/OmpV family) n=1 Tax=Pelotalea chapellei TaxID=44671 RepID=A0ABS5U4N3_9BACT|nr:hypothetical protein [Pelotalea chapellei]MBT1070615.1 hypothetical protein [Pelotalea chapellei]
MPFTVSSMRRENASKRLTTFFLTLLSVCMIANGALADDAVKFEHKLSPGVLTAHGDWTVAADYRLGISTELWSQPTGASFRKHLAAHVSTKGAMAVDPDLNTTPLTADAGLTTSINLYRPSKVIPGEQPGEFRTLEEGFNYGRLSLSLLGGYETDQRLDNRNFTGGVELGYVLTENQRFKAIVPSIFIGYDFVRVDHSRLQRSLGVNDEDSGRLRLFGSWKFPVGQWLPGPFDPLNAHLDIRYYLSSGTPDVIRALDKDDALYIAGALSYSFEKPLLGFVNAAFIRVAEGRIPPVINDVTTVTVGLTVWER